MLKQEEQRKFRQNKNNNSNITMNEHNDYHYNSNSDKEIGGKDNSFDNYYYNNG